MDEKTTSPRRQAVVDDDQELRGAPHVERVSAPALAADPVAEIPTPVVTPSPVDIFKAALLTALDDPHVVAKLGERFAEWTELRPDAFRNPTRWQQRAGR